MAGLVASKNAGSVSCPKRRFGGPDRELGPVDFVHDTGPGGSGLSGDGALRLGWSRTKAGRTVRRLEMRKANGRHLEPF